MTRALARALSRRRAGEETRSELNIVPMLDIMVIILVFLLKTVGESSASIPQSNDLALPLSTSRAEPAERGIVVTVSKSQILVGDQKVVELGTRQGRSGELYIAPLGEAVASARRSGGKREREAVIVADRTTPFRLLIEVLYTLGQQELGTYHLMVMQGR